MPHKTIVGFLSWLTNENMSYRHERHQLSLKSLSCLNEKCHILIINNGGINTLKEKVRNIIPNFFYLDLEKNFYDTVVQLSTYYLAEKHNIPYFINAYDDFVFYDENFIKQAEKFMDIHQNISCMRLPKYEHKFSHKYDTRFTPKSINPESVSHMHAAGNQKLNNFGPYVIDDKSFYFSNWRPCSRPTLWRTSEFSKFIQEENIKIMQPFEAHMINVADDLMNKNQYMSSFIDGGVCHTFPIETSDRTKTNVDNLNIKISKKEIFEIIDKRLDKVLLCRTKNNGNFVIV
jgi:hypothetical protein